MYINHLRYCTSHTLPTAQNLQAIIMNSEFNCSHICTSSGHRKKVSNKRADNVKVSHEQQFTYTSLIGFSDKWYNKIINSYICNMPDYWNANSWLYHEKTENHNICSVNRCLWSLHFKVSCGFYFQACKIEITHQSKGCQQYLGLHTLKGITVFCIHSNSCPCPYKGPSIIF